MQSVSEICESALFLSCLISESDYDVLLSSIQPTQSQNRVFTTVTPDLHQGLCTVI